MTSCQYCMLVQDRTGMLFEDDAFLAFLHPRPASPGHFVVVPKEHVTVFEQLPVPAAGKLLAVANRLAGAAFDALPNLGGTNLLIQSGPAAGQDVPHAAVHIIPRREGDGLPFEPPRKQLADEAMASIEEQLRKAIEGVTSQPEPAPKEEKPEKPAAKEPRKPVEAEWVKRQLRRRP
jgi:histidine triad (HIT) family protein